VFLGEVTDEGDFGTNVVIQLVGFDLVDGLLHYKFVHQPTNEAVIVQIEEISALRAVYERPQVAQKMGIHGNT
jgi:hypothetical protein